MSFTLSTGNVAVPSASAAITTNAATSATITVTASCYLTNGWVQSTGVVAKIYINGSLVSTQTILGNGTYYSASTTKSVSAASTISKGQSAKSIAWSVQFCQYTDSVDQGVKETISGTQSVAALASYSVAYNANGGSGAPSSQTKWYGTAITLSTTKPTRTGYTFKNWNTLSGGTGTPYAPGASYTGNASVVLYAQWTANTYTITYNANGGSGAPSSQTKTHGVNLTLSTTTPTRTNYNFLGWSTSSTATTAEYTSGGTYTANTSTTLYAVWELAYWNPKIWGLIVDRCTSDGTLDDYATYASINFNWECCQLLGTNNAKSAVISYKLSTSSTWTTDTTITMSTTSGSVSNQVIGSGLLSVDNTYDVQVVIEDDKGGSTTAIVNLQAASFAMDILKYGYGVAFGKPAEEANILDVAYGGKFRKNVTIQNTSNDDPEVSNDSFMFTSELTDSAKISFGVSSGGTTRGIYDNTLSKWLFHTDGTNVYANSNRIMHGYYLNSYWGLMNPEGSTSGWMRTTNSGLLPYASGGSSSSLGMSSWPFNNIYGKTIYANGRSLTANTVLWSGGSHMNASQSATFSNSVSDQPSGIVLVFSEYVPSTAEVKNQGFWARFVPKYAISAHSGCFFEFVEPCWSNLPKTYVKGLYLSNTGATGHSYNTKSDDNYYSSYCVLRYVIGV